MKHSRCVSAGVAAGFLLVMILDSKTALAGSCDGVQLCVATVIPSLFPFFVVSIILTGVLSGCRLPFPKKLSRALGLPQGSETLLLIGFLGGYPVGAQCVAQACQNGGLSRREGERMLAFCSNAGPAFLFGIGTTLFSEQWICWLLWIIHIISALIVAVLTPGAENVTPLHLGTQSPSLANSMQRSVKAMAMVCGWIVIFRTLIAFCERWFLWLLPGNLQLLLTGLAEMTNGCCSLSEISSEGLRMQLFSLFIGFGGLCVLLQTNAVLSGSGLIGSYYFPGKVLQASISYLLCMIVQPLLKEDMRYFPAVYWPALALALCFLYGLRWIRMKKSSSIPVKIGV